MTYAEDPVDYELLAIAELALVFPRLNRLGDCRAGDLEWRDGARDR
jgi:hypothetical protein